MKIAQDKIDHLVWGAMFALFGFAVAYFFEFSNFWYLASGLLMSALAGASKELLWDAWLSRKFAGKKLPILNKIIVPGCVEGMDFIATIIGGTVIVIITFFIRLIF